MTQCYILIIIVLLYCCTVVHYSSLNFSQLPGCLSWQEQTRAVAKYRFAQINRTECCTCWLLHTTQRSYLPYCKRQVRFSSLSVAVCVESININIVGLLRLHCAERQGAISFTYLLTNLLIYLLSDLLTLQSRVLLEKLTGLQLVKFPAFYGTRRFITAFTSARHLSLS
jgi:hypothetical protein